MTLTRSHLLATIGGCLIANGGIALAEPPTCVPVARLSGNDSLVAAISESLAGREIRVSAKSECGVVSAELSRDGERIVVRVTDAAGRREERWADDVGGAATIVESWVRRDVAMPLLAARSAPRPTATRSPPESLPAPATVAKLDGRGFTVAANADFGATSDGAVWAGARVNGCVVLGRLCVGGLVRYAADLRQEGSSSRSIVDVMGTADIPVRLGRFTLLPGVGLGQSVLRAKAVDGDGADNDGSTNQTSGVRVRAHTGISFRLSPNWTIQGDLALDAVGLADRSFGEHEGSMNGMPSVHGWFGIGLSYGGPMSPKLVPIRRIEGSSSDMSDDALLAGCATDEVAAQGALFDRYHADVYRFVARLSGTDKRDLDDLVQATFEAVLRSAKKFDGRSSVKTWIFGIANNVVRHHVRTEMRRKRLAIAFASSPRETAVDQSAEAATRELSARLREAIDALSPRLRQAFVMVYFEELSGREAARIMGVREKTIWMSLHRARAELRARLQGVRP